jgi:SAM-dependent methyltransferase
MPLYGGLHTTNGYAKPPWPIYDQFLKVVDTPGPVLELACGNGLLLRFLFDLCGLALEPYGLDINRDAITEAKRVVFPEREDCFVHADLRDGIPFRREFATILTNPLNADQGYYEQVGGRIQRLHDAVAVERYVARCWRSVAPGGRLILWCYDGHVKEIARDYEAFLSAIMATSIEFRAAESGPVVYWISDRKSKP